MARPDRKGPPSTSTIDSLHRFWQRANTGYLGDYLGLILLLAAYLTIQFSSEPWHRFFRLDDPRIQFPHASVERADIFHVLLLAGLLPLLVLLAWTLLLSRKRGLFDLHKSQVTIIGLLTSIILTCFVTDVLKDGIGRPRPDLLARCKPAPDTPEHELVSVAVCTETQHHLLHDGWRSFPSGHSSFAFSGLGYLAIFLASQTHALQPRAGLASVLLSLAPLLGAAMIAISRLEDYRHDYADVMAGSILGSLVAYATWRRYYPSPLAVGCDVPYIHSIESGSRRSSPNGIAFQRVRDVEEGLNVDGAVDGFARVGVR